MQTQKLFFARRPTLLPLLAIVLYLKLHTQDINPGVFLVFILLPVTYYIISGLTPGQLQYVPGKNQAPTPANFFLHLQRRAWELNLSRKQNEVIQGEKKPLG